MIFFGMSYSFCFLISLHSDKSLELNESFSLKMIPVLEWNKTFSMRVALSMLVN